MKTVYPIKHYLLFAILASSVFLGACKKNKAKPDGENSKQTPTTNRVSLSNDSLFLYAKEIYFWNTALPSYDTFDPRQYTNRSTNLANYEDNLFNIVKASGSADYINGNSEPKYSYIFDKTNANPIGSIIRTTSSVDLEGNGNDIGLRLGYYGNSNSNYSIYVSAVYQNSPADKAGFVRGDKIKQIQGVTYGTNFNADVIQINNAIAASTVSLAAETADGVAFNKTLTKTSYSSSPIYKSKVLTAGTKKIGYLAYARFSNEGNSIQALDNVFRSFSSDGVTDLIIDLRYNGGGYISTAEHLVNLIAPNSAQGVMYVEYYNAMVRDHKATILKNQPYVNAQNQIDGTYFDGDYSVAGNTVSFKKSGPLTGVTNVVFIVTGSTASASELVINSLKPYMNVQLVGETTYGKPIGFFPITIENRYDVYFSLFETKNSRGEGGYYNGMTPNVTSSEISTKMYDFGNPSDIYTARAVNLLSPNIPATGQAKTASVLEKTGTGTIQKIGSGNNGEFVGMIEDRRR